MLTDGRDDSFNSITGLNGSGKSNILDAICFVLGITNMSTVRAQNLQVSPTVATGVEHADRITRISSISAVKPVLRKRALPSHLRTMTPNRVPRISSTYR